MKKNVLLVLCFLPTVLCGCQGGKSGTVNVTDLDKVGLHTEEQNTYVYGNTLDKTPNDVVGTLEKSKPVPVKIDFSYDDGSKKELPKDAYFVFKLSENEDFKDAKFITTRDQSVSLSNLKIATDYYYQVEYRHKKVKSVSETKSFYTDETKFRTFDIEGVANARDIGGFVYEDHTSKQGLVLRTGRLNVSASDSAIYPSDRKDVILDVTEDGMDVLLNDLHVKTEIDVRKPSNNETGYITSSPLGDTVSYVNIPMEWNISGSQNILDYNKAEVVRFFEVLGKKESYPIFFHCDIGTDRTGMFSVLMHGLIGDEMDDIHKDYMFSNFGMIKSSRVWSKTDGYRKKIENTSGETFAEKTKNYLVDTIGCNANDIDNFVKYMKEGIDIDTSRRYSYIKVDGASRKLLKGDKDYIDVQIQSDKLFEEFKPVFVSSDENIIKVNEYGEVEALASGTADVEIKMDGVKTKVVHFKVSDPAVDKIYQYKFEGELATLGGSGNSKPSVKDKYRGDEEFGTDGVCISCVDSSAGQYIEYNLTSEVEQTVSLQLKVSCYSRAFEYGNKCVKNVVANGTTFTIDKTLVDIDNPVKFSTMPWYNWGSIYVHDVNLNAGNNVIRINIANSPKTNFDYLGVDAKNPVIITK